jgi:hypothetical protein
VGGLKGSPQFLSEQTKVCELTEEDLSAEALVCRDGT